MEKGYKGLILAAPEKITEEIYQIGGTNISNPMDSAVYLLDLGELVLIECGSGKGFNRLIRNIEFFGFDPADISTVILTHCHVDHVGGASLFRSHFNTSLVMHTLDAEIVERADTRLTAAFCFDIDFQPLPIDVKLSGGQGSFSFRKCKLYWLHTPGHTPGSISVYMDLDGKRVLFPQDIGAPLLKDFDCDPVAWMNSIQKLSALDADMICDGHSGAYGPKSVVKEYLQYCIDSQRQMGYITP